MHPGNVVAEVENDFEAIEISKRISSIEGEEI